MAFDFFKKKELLKIKELESELVVKNNGLLKFENELVNLLKCNKELEKELSVLSKYIGIVDVDNEIAKIKANSEKELVQIQNEKDKIKNHIEDLKNNYNEAYAIYLSLKHQSELYTESLDLAEYGVYEPYFEFDTSESYKESLNLEREYQKNLIKNGMAVEGGEKIMFNDSISQGQAIVKKQKKLILRAFNGECDSFISTVDWNNFKKMEERIEKSFEAINSVYKEQGIEINLLYKYSKIRELELAYGYKYYKKEEKEEQRLIREQMREDEKATREFETARIKAEKEANDYQEAIKKAKIEAENTEGEKHNKLIAKIQELEERLKEAEINKERAISMAQQTRRGHIYIISNIGSFGDNVYKIGMTRRLDPMDRVKELGDASVPFSFDVHAIIFSEDAPKLERDLHIKFEDRRLNVINARKEFFNVSLSEIEQFVKETYGRKIEFIKIAEAKEYRETLAIKQKVDIKENINTAFPKNLFV